jgi:2-polyprenyl-6-methoxyphenol hydroxylase-like FAD-dependent oxidoreductase
VRIAVIGGGTAGFIAAAHITRRLPEAELLHVFDSRLPTIGVGEGTTPRFPLWLEETTGLGFADLAARCGATLKRGTLFHGWGRLGGEFLNRFHPTRLIGYHFDATEVVRVLGEHVRAERVDARVEQVHTLPGGVRLRYANGAIATCDYAIDARGFPRLAALHMDDFIQLNWVPTGRAILRWLPPGGLSGSTRAIARPHGWIFQIPLQHATSSGYIFNPRISSDAEVEADFTACLEEEGFADWTHRGVLDFPNFLRRTMFDGRVFSVGNAASFLEPLEATAIGTAIVQVREVAHWIADRGCGSTHDTDEVDYFNGALVAYICRNSLFVAWHYACGSRWNTAFWDYARGGLERARRSAVARVHLAAMEEYIEAGRMMPGPALSAYEDVDRWEEDIYPLLRIYKPFGNFSEINFAQVGHGIGYYDARPEPPHPAGIGVAG